MCGNVAREVYPTDQVPPANPPAPGSRVWRRVPLLLILAAGALAAGALIGLTAWLTLAQRRVRVTGASMLPLLAPGEAVLVDRLAYRLGRPARRDVVLAHLPGAPLPAIKLLAGLPGEVVSVARDRLWIDGEPLDLGRPVVGSSPGEWRLGPEEYFLLSANLALGTDSRHVGPVRRDALLGRGWLVYAPAERRRRLARPSDWGAGGANTGRPAAARSRTLTP
jgi:signal peptidase I